MNPDVSISHYLESAQRATATKTTYRYGLSDFAQWLETFGRPIEGATTSDVTGYLKELQQTRNKNESSIAARFYVLRGYFRWLEEIGAIAQSPMVHLRAQSITWGYPNIVPVEDLRLLLENAQNKRAWVLIAILAFNSLRVSELIDCDIANIERRQGTTYLRFVSMTGKHRLPLTILHPEVAHHLNVALNGRRSGPLFVNPDGNRIHRSTAGGIIRQAGKRAGLSYKVTPQMLAYTLFAAALESGFSLVSLMRSAGVPQPRQSDRWLTIEQPLAHDNASLRLARMVLQPADSTHNLLSQGESVVGGTTEDGFSVMAAGAVLERHLRQLCTDKGISLLRDQDLGSMSKWAGELQKLGILETSDRHLIDSIGNLRNFAAHGFFDRCGQGSGERTFQSVRELVDKYPL